MSYLGKTQLKSSDIQRFDVTSSTSATHVLSWTAPNEQSLIITINGVKQQDDAYSIAGSPTTVTLTDALVATDELEIIGIVDVGTMNVPGVGSVQTDQLADDAVTADKLANSINTEIAANTAKVTNATHTGDVTGATALTIANDAVDIAMLSATGTADSTTFLRGDNAWAAATTDARYVYAYLETSHQAVSSGVDTLVQLNGATQSHSAYNTGTYTWTATADDAGIWIFIAQCSVHYDNSNGDESKTYIYLNDVKSSGAYAWTWTGGTDYLRHYTFSQQYLVSISTSDTIKMYASLTAPSGTINLFSGDVASGPKANSLLGFKL
jgi:hypothetical protein